MADSLEEKDPHGTRGSTEHHALDYKKEVKAFSSADILASFQSAQRGGSSAATGTSLPSAPATAARGSMPFFRAKSTSDRREDEDSSSPPTASPSPPFASIIPPESFVDKQKDGTKAQNPPIIAHGVRLAQAVPLEQQGIPVGVPLSTSQTESDGIAQPQLSAKALGKRPMTTEQAAAKEAALAKSKAEAQRKAAKAADKEATRARLEAEARRKAAAKEAAKKAEAQRKKREACADVCVCVAVC